MLGFATFLYFLTAKILARQECATALAGSMVRLVVQSTEAVTLSDAPSAALEYSFNYDDKLIK